MDILGIINPLIFKRELLHYYFIEFNFNLEDYPTSFSTDKHLNLSHVFSGCFNLVYPLRSPMTSYLITSTPQNRQD